MRLLVTGADGQLGRALRALAGDRVVMAAGRSELDITDAEAVTRRIAEVHPDVVVNAAAYNNVDGAEGDGAPAFAVNSIGPMNLARACRTASALLVHVSTDYVFDGTKTVPYGEADCPSPANAYGVSKLAGELLVRASSCPFLIVRTSGLFGPGGNRVKGGSFVERIVSRARAGGPLRVVSDQVFSPTYAPHLASALLALIEHGARGLYHVTNGGSCSWYDVAAATVEGLGLAAPVEKIRAQDLGAAARRPAYSVLDNENYRRLGLAALPSWSAALAEFLAS